MATATEVPSNVELVTSSAAKTLDASLWWEPFADFLTELENAAVASDFNEWLEKKLKEYHHAWFLDTVTKFKKSNQSSRKALESSQIKIGEHELDVVHELRETAFRISSILCLDEAQSYILVKRTLERNRSSVGEKQPNFLNLVIIDYYTERQCLLKCTRDILVHALHCGSQCNGGSAVMDEAQSLASDDLGGKLLSVLEDVLSSNYPAHMDVDISILWYEEMLAEGKLILDILFLIYYESFSSCDTKCWKRLCALYEGIASGSYHIQKLAVTPEAVHEIYILKVQLLLILIEALNLENLLQMLHDNVPLSEGSIGFLEADILQLDTVISSLNAFQSNEFGPLVLAWAVFLSLISSLPGKEELKSLMDLDNVGYSRQAFEVSPLGFFLEILESDILKFSDGPIAGYWSVMRTFISAFLASYEINIKFDDKNLKLVLEILSKIYRGEESLCVQFWDKNSYIDGPIRHLLCNLESEFPFRTTEFLCLLSALCEGDWSAECVYNFLDKSVGLTTPFEMSSCSSLDDSNVVETSLPLSIPGIESLVIPSKTQGQVLRIIDENCVLVRWEYRESGVILLVLKLAQGLYMQNLNELIVILDLICRLVNFNLGACYSLMAARDFLQEETYGVRIQEISVDIVEIICTLLKGLSTSVNGTVMMALGIKILAKMLTCSPSRVASVAMDTNNLFGVTFGLNPFDINRNSSPSGSWMLTGRLSKMLLIDCEESDCSLTIAVLEFTTNLLEIGSQNDVFLALVVFSLQYVLVNHELWNYKVKHSRWKVTMKVIEVLKKCVWSSTRCQKMLQSLHDVLLSDSSIHSVILRIICTTTPILEKLSLSRLFDTWDIEGLHLALSSSLDVLAGMISSPLKDSPSFAFFHDAMLSPMTKPVPVVTAAISFISYFRNSMIQIRAARLLAVLFATEPSEDLIYSNTNLRLNEMQVSSFRKSVCRILLEQLPWNEDLVVAIMQLLTAAASNQPGFLNFIFSSNKKLDAEVCDSNAHQPSNSESASLKSKEECICSAILLYLKKSEDLFHRKSKILLCIVKFMRELWQGAPKFIKTLEHLKGSDDFWRLLTYSAVVTSNNYESSSDKLTEVELQEVAYKYQYLSNTLDILNYEIFLQKKIMHARIVAKRISGIPTNEDVASEESKLTMDMSLHTLKEIFLSWCKSPILSNLIKACASWEYDRRTHFQAKVASCLVAVLIMLKIRTGDLGSLSVFLINIMTSLTQKLCKLPAYLELLNQYGDQGYSQRHELENLILSDLFYHIRGELEGRKIDNKLFKELMQFLIDSNFFATYNECRQDNFLPIVKSIYLCDIVQLSIDLGLEMWDHLRWAESMEVGEAMLILQRENSTILCTKSKLEASRGLITLLHMTEAAVKHDGFSTILKMSEELFSTIINHVCQCLQETVTFLTPNFDVIGDVIDILEAQAELLLVLLTNVRADISHTVYLHVLSTSGYSLNVLCSCQPSRLMGIAIEILLMLIVTSTQLIGKEFQPKDTVQIEYIGSSDGASNTILGLLPVLCGCIARTDYLTLSLAAIDIILKGFSNTFTWFPILQKHLPLQLIVNKLQDVTSPRVISVILKFLLKISRVRQGAEMLLNVGILEYLKVLLDTSSDGWPSSSTNTEKVLDKTWRNPQQIWGHCLAVLTAVIQSTGDSSSSVTIVEFIMAGILAEKAPLVSHHHRVPGFAMDSDKSSRVRAVLPSISLNDLKETQSTWVLICILARDWNSWKRVSPNMESQLREKSIHLLALIGKVAHPTGDSTRRDAPPLLCPPLLKQEFEYYSKPSFINSQNGWFAVAANCCKLDPKVSSSLTALLSRDQSNVNSDPTHTHFSDLVSIEIYNICFLLLKFLCIQAECAARKAEDVGLVDLTHFPELPMPDILHGLQDQGMAIITELCSALNKMSNPETQQLCLLLWHIIIMSLYLEYCVIQICGIRPVVGHVEVLSKELRLLFRASEGHFFLKEPLNALKQIVCFVYPDLLHHEALF